MVGMQPMSGAESIPSGDTALSHAIHAALGEKAKPELPSRATLASYYLNTVGRVRVLFLPVDPLRR